MKERPYYRTIVVSDIHLGTTHSKVNQISDFLSRVDCRRLILNGDIIDGWHLQMESRTYALFQNHHENDGKTRHGNHLYPWQS